MSYVGIVIILLWMVCGVIGFGLCLGYFQGRWPQFAWRGRVSHVGLSMFVSLSGPVGMIMAYWRSNYAQYGLNYHVTTKDESWAAHQVKYPALSYNYFLNGA